MAKSSMQERKKARWLGTWVSSLDSKITNFLCSADAFHQFTLALGSVTFSIQTQRLVWYLFIERVINHVLHAGHNEGDGKMEVNPNLLPSSPLVLEPAEAEKFKYVVGWLIYKLLKNDKVTQSHGNFATIRKVLGALASERIEHVPEMRTQITNFVPGENMMKFMYLLESLVLKLFDKYEKYGADILIYIRESLLANITLISHFESLIKHSLSILTTECSTVPENDIRFLFERLIGIYMKSRQRTWRRFGDLIPEKGSSSLRENLKAMKGVIEPIKENKKK